MRAKREVSDASFGFLIVIPVADRPEALATCLDTICAHLHLFPYGRTELRSGVRTFSDIRIVVIDDGASSFYGPTVVQSFARKGLLVDWVDSQRQQVLLSSLDTSYLTSFLGDANQRVPRGAGISGNIGKLVAWASLRNFPADKQWLIWHLDSDHQLTTLTRHGDGHTTLQPDAHNYFATWNRLFQDPTVDMIAGPVTGDPTVSPMVMINTVLIDLLHFLENMRDSKGLGLTVRPTRPVTDYASEKMAYYDFQGVLRGRVEQPSGAYSPFGTAVNLSELAPNYFAKLNLSLYGHHPTRPILAPPAAEVNANLWPTARPTRMIFTGNYIYRKSMLRYPLPFVSHKPRLIGPIFGTALRAWEGPKIRFFNMPVYHERVPVGRQAAESRSGVIELDGMVDLASENCRQVMGDVLLDFIDEATRRHLIGSDAASVHTSSVHTSQLDQVFSQVVMGMRERYLNHIEETTRLVAMIEAACLRNDRWWSETGDGVLLMGKVSELMTAVKHNFITGSKVNQFVENLPEIIASPVFISETLNLHIDWLNWYEKALQKI